MELVRDLFLFNEHQLTTYKRPPKKASLAIHVFYPFFFGLLTSCQLLISFPLLSITFFIPFGLYLSLFTWANLSNIQLFLHAFC